MFLPDTVGADERAGSLPLAGLGDARPRWAIKPFRALVSGRALTQAFCVSKAEILNVLPTLRPDERQEILDRLCDLREAELGAVHQEWVNEALSSGPAPPCGGGRLGRSFEEGIGARDQASVNVVYRPQFWLDLEAGLALD